MAEIKVRRWTVGIPETDDPLSSIAIDDGAYGRKVRVFVSTKSLSLRPEDLPKSENIWHTADNLLETLRDVIGNNQVEKVRRCDSPASFGGKTAWGWSIHLWFPATSPAKIIPAKDVLGALNASFAGGFANYVTQFLDCVIDD